MRTIALVLALAAGAPDAAAQDCAPGRSAPLAFPGDDRGVTPLRTTVAPCGRPLRAFLVRLAGAHVRLGLEVQRSADSGTMSVPDYLKASPGAVAAISGGFLASFLPPIPDGYVKARGVVKNRLRPSPLLDGLLCLDTLGFPIVAEARAENAQTAPDCLQSGPVLAVNGKRVDAARWKKLPPSFLAPNQRAFVAVLGNRDSVFGLVEDATLSDVAELVVRPPAGGGLGARSAINLSGGGSASVALVTGEREGDLYMLVPNAIVAARR